MRQIPFANLKNLRPTLCTIFLLTYIINQNYIHNSPPYPESFIFLFTNEMLYQFITLQPKQILIRNLPSKFLVHYCLFQSLLKLRNNQLRSIFFQMQKIQFLRKTIFRNLIPIQQRKNQSITDQRLKHLCNIQTQRKPPCSWFMQITNCRIQLRMITSY